MDNKLIIAGKSYSSRLLVGTGKYKDFTETKAAIEASGSEIITIAIRRSNIGQNPNEPSLLEILPPSKYTLLPNTAGCLFCRRCGAHLASGPRIVGRTQPGQT